MINFKNQDEINKVNGNIMAYLSDRELEAKHRAQIMSLLNDEHCKNCGQKSCQKYDEYINTWVEITIEENGLCNKCSKDFSEFKDMEEFYGN